MWSDYSAATGHTLMEVERLLVITSHLYAKTQLSFNITVKLRVAHLHSFGTWETCQIRLLWVSNSSRAHWRVQTGATPSSRTEHTTIFMSAFLSEGSETRRVLSRRHVLGQRTTHTKCAHASTRWHGLLPVMCLLLMSWFLVYLRASEWHTDIILHKIS